MPSLSEMPEVVMKRILEKSDIRSVFTLRKVSRDLRNFIDDVVPDSGVKLLEISVEGDVVKSRLNFLNGQHYLLKYAPGEVRIQIGQREISKPLDSEDHVTVFLEDLRQILKFQTSEMGYLEVESVSLTPDHQRILDSLEQILSSRQRLLKVKNVRIQVGNSSHPLKILPFLAPGALETIGFSKGAQIEKLDVKKISELEQWKKATSLFTYDLVLESEVSNFSNFLRGDISVDELSVDDVVNLKKTFQHSTGFQHFHLRFRNFEEKLKVSDALGPPTSEDHDGDRWWKFEYPRNDELFTVFLGTDTLYFRHLY